MVKRTGGDRLRARRQALCQVVAAPPRFREYADLGASVECYRDQRFFELESLGPLTDLEPGAALHHREVWTLIGPDERPLDQVLASLPEQPAEMVD